MSTLKLQKPLQKELAKKYKCSEMFVSLAIAGQRNSPLAQAIRLEYGMSLQKHGRNLVSMSIAA